MSILRIDNLQSLVGTQSVAQNRIYRGTNTVWVNFNGTGTVSIRDSYNTSSITDNGVGDYTVNFTNALSNSNFSVGVGFNDAAASSNTLAIVSLSSSSVRISGGIDNDIFVCSVTVLGGF